MTHPLLVLHDLGEERGGAAWRDALVQGAWDGPWSAPDQPGHGGAPWEADYYEPAHLVMAPLRHLLDTGWRERPVIVAVGASADAGELLALGGKAAGVVVVDRPCMPGDVTPDESIGADYAWLRRLADDPAAQAPAPYGRTDPRTRLGLAPHHNPQYAARQRAAIPVPVLEVDRREPAEVLATVRQWWAGMSEAL
jgi:hypothetical protein